MRHGGRVSRSDENDCVKRCVDYEVDSVEPMLVLSSLPTYDPPTSEESL